jgi:hypothetical protein
MKKQNSYRQMLACLAAALTLLGTASAVRAAAPALQGSLTIRPLTPTEIKTYGLTGSNAQFSAGCKNVALGEPVYIDAMVNAAIAPSNIVGVAWTLNRQAGSLAALSPSPLSNSVPLYNTSDRYTGESASPAYQLAGRAFFRPDVEGSYTVNATITTVGSGSTNLAVTITAGMYVGVQTCAGCHSGGVVFNGRSVPSIYPTYTNTPHASFFARAIDGLVSSHYSKSCISCHVLGYDTNSFANNLGFDDLALLNNWTFPSVLTNNPSNWASMQANYPSVAGLANIQCENCHGPGDQHIFSQGVVGNTNAISVNYAAGDCAQCHDSLSGHFKSAEWNNSLHAAASRTPSGASRPQCVRCHTAPGFAGWATAGGMAMLNKYPTNIFWANSTSTNILAYTGSGPAYTTPATPPNTAYYPITCQACHDPHDASNPHQLRMGYNVTLSDGTVVTNAGAGGFCMECHNNRNGSYTNMLAKVATAQPNWAGGNAFGTHDSPQGDILEGVNAETYGKVIPSAPHASVVADTCAGCHMQPVAATVVVNGVTNANPAFTLAGGHTFKMSYINTNGIEVPVTDVCTPCHGKLDSFDFKVADYNGDGVVEGVQTEVRHLLDKLSTLLPPRYYYVNGSYNSASGAPTVYHSNPNDYAADGIIKNSDSLMAIFTNVPAKFLKAYYNWDIVFRDNSFGVHNAPFAVGLLKASIADLTGDANGDGLPDSWQIANFGGDFANNPLAGPNAVNNSAGVPNWMMYALGLAPNAAFTVAGSGVIYFNGNNIVNGATNTIAIYKAAEIAFDTQVGVSYQIQGISNLTGAWQNISTNIPGTGGTISYLTPTRNNAQMFFRVVHTP